MTRRPPPRDRHRIARLRPASLRAAGTTDAAPAVPDLLGTQALVLENALLMRELGRAQRRCTQWHDDAARRIDALECGLLRARGDAIVKTTQLAVLREALAQMLRRSPHQVRPAAATLRHLRVLCVGGRTRQMPLYQALVEERGGRFAQVCGADEAGLRRALAEADVVVLQPRYVCQVACRLVEAHCARTGLRCLQLDKCCLPGFASSLDAAAMSA